MRSIPDLSDRTPDSVEVDWSAAVARAAVYGMLSRSLLYPNPDGHEHLRQELVPLVEGLACGSDAFDVLLGEAVAALDDDLDELRRSHGRLFTHIENQDCPVHESAYAPGDVFRRADVMADISAFYQAHGLRVGGPNRERVDHIAAELEFMSFLARKQAHAIDQLGPDEVAECHRSQQLFLQDHLACWAPGFAARVELLADHRFLRAIGALLAAWIGADCEWLGVEAAADLGEPQPLPAPDDGLCAVSDVSLNVTTGATPVQLRRRSP